MWAVLLSLLTLTAAKPPNEGKHSNLRFIRDDKAKVIKGEAHFQYMNEAKENNIMNLKFAENREALSENNAEIQQDTAEEQYILDLDCPGGYALIYVQREVKKKGWDMNCNLVSIHL